MEENISSLRSNAARFESILGEYYLGLLHAATVHQRFSVSGSQESLGKNDLQQRVTSLHEMLHALQDMLTGFGAFVSSNLDNLLCTIRLTTSYLALKHGRITVPLPQWSKVLPAEDARLVREMLDNCTALTKNLEFIQRKNSCGIGVQEILEGTAAFFSEVAERYSRWTDFYDETVTLGRYNFDEICEAVAKRHPPYTAFVADYREWTQRLPSATSSRQKSNLLFLLHDIALDIPPPDAIRLRLRLGLNKADDFIPGFRYRKAMEAILESRLEIPDLPSPMISASVTAWSKARDGTSGFFLDDVSWERLKLANQEFGGNANKPTGEYFNFIDQIYSYPSLSWPTRKETLDTWLKEIPEHHPLSSFQLFREWRIRCLMSQMEGSPFWDFAAILNQIILFPFPLMYLTPIEARFWVGNASEETLEILTDFSKHVAYNMYSTGIAPQVIAARRFTCPFARTPWTKEIKCPETAACSEAIELGDPKYDNCLFGNYFRVNFGVPPSKAEYADLVS